VRVNLGRVPALESWWTDLGIFGLFLLAWLAALVWRYRRTPAGTSAATAR
jgi:hypothetical protein